MYPILLKIPLGPVTIPIPGYGVMLAIAFSVGLYLTIQRAKVEGLDPEDFLNVSTYVILAALIGSRLFHVFIEHPSYYLSNPLEIPKIWKGGYTFYGGMIPAALVFWWYVKKRHMPMLQSMDISATYLMLGMAIGRLGCFLAGCCHGKVCDFLLFPISYVTTHPDSFSRPLGIPLYATQIWESAGSFSVFLFILWLRKRKKFHGQLVAALFIGYPIVRIFVEIFRGDDIRGFLIPGLVSTSQFIGLIMMIIGFIIWRQARKHPIPTK